MDTSESRIKKGAPERSGPGADSREPGCSQIRGTVIVFKTLGELKVFAPMAIRLMLKNRTWAKGPAQVIAFERQP